MTRAARIADAVGRGLLAGAVGTAAMTLSGALEARWRRRAPSMAPGRAAAHVLGIEEFEDEKARQRFNDLSHWAYGTGWGVPRGLLGMTRTGSATATVLHGGLVWGTAQIALPALDVAPPFVFRPREEIAINLLHHAVYAAATGGALARLGR
jgi:hypothetical protein